MVSTIFAVPSKDFPAIVRAVANCVAVAAFPVNVAPVMVPLPTVKLVAVIAPAEVTEKFGEVLLLPTFNDVDA